MRLVEMREQSPQSTAELHLFRPVKRATRTNIIEEDAGPAEVREGTVIVPLKPAGIETVRIAF